MNEQQTGLIISSVGRELCVGVCPARGTTWRLLQTTGRARIGRPKEMANLYIDILSCLTYLHDILLVAQSLRSNAFPNHNRSWLFWQ